ncbi:MAG: hypothetical protein AAGA67_03290 [Cyanobacteria bacterium P01_F01_bin.153]
MGIQLNLRFKSLDVTFKGDLQDIQLVKLARTLQKLVAEGTGSYPFEPLFQLVDQVDQLFPILSLNDKFSALKGWLVRSPEASGEDTEKNSETKPESEPTPETSTTRSLSEASEKETPDLSWLPDFLETLIREAIRPKLSECKTLSDYERNELLQGLPDRVDGEIFRVGIFIGGDQSSSPSSFDAAKSVDDAITDFNKRRSPSALAQETTTLPKTLPIPTHFQSDRIAEVWRVPYQERAAEAKQWAEQHHISPASEDQTRTALLLIDVQNTFCLPDFELFVAGRSGAGAVDDSRRLCEFIYRHLGVITDIIPTLDTHSAAQIFHPTFWVDDAGQFPAPMTIISSTEVESGKWQVNPSLKGCFREYSYTDNQTWALHYVRQLEQAGKYPLTVWPFHGMLGGIGHALVSAVEEAIFFHSIARCSPTRYEPKGQNPLTENYSALRPEVSEAPDGQIIAAPNSSLIQRLLAYDRIIIAGQAKSHCVAWTIADLLDEINKVNPAIAQRVYLLEDCTSPVVVPNIVDYTDAANQAFAEFAAAGMNCIQSLDFC